MRFVTNRAFLLRVILTFILTNPAVALAQTASERQEPRAEPTVERIKSGFVLAPDFKFTEVDDEFGGLAGAYGGYLIDQRLLIGGGFYWLANGSDARQMAYGGALLEYVLRPSKLVHLSVRGLVGAGSSTLGFDLQEPERERFGFHGFDRFGDHRGPVPERRGFLHYDDFFIAEPQANVFFNLAPWLRVGLGASYRFIGATEVGDRLKGVSGNLSVVFGSF